MQKNIRQKILKGILLGLSVGLAVSPVVVSATTFSTMTSSIFNSNSSEACNQCHDSSLVGAAARSDAPDGADFNIYSEAASRAVTMEDYTSTGYMPMLPGSSFVDTTDLNGSEMAIVTDWLNDGTPFASATASTLTITSQQKTSVTLRGSVDTNTTNSTAQSGKDGEWYFQWGPGSTATYSNGQVGNTTRNSIAGITGSFSLTGLACGNSYHFRAVARNGHNTANGSKVNFSTSSCTAPVISEGASISPTATNEETITSFVLNRTDNDPGTLTWSVSTQGSKGTLSFLSSTTASPVTVRYTPSSNQNGSDTAGRIRITNSTTGLTDTIIVNMNITPVNDQPSITSTASTSAIEDTLYSYQVVVNDPDDSFGTGLTIGLSNAPAGMSVNPGTGLITWIPTNSVTTSDLVTVSVNDGLENGTVLVMQQFTVAVTATNDPPVITSTAGTVATEDIQYSYQVQISDVDDTNNGADISFTLGSEPVGMLVSNTGLITWTPLEGVTTSGAVTVTVEDGNEDTSTPTVGNNGQEIFTVAVTVVNDPANITSTAIMTGDESVPYSYAVTASDVDDTGGFGAGGNQLQISLSGEPAGMIVAPSTGVITWTPPRTGAQLSYNNITVTVQDGLEDGAVISQETFSVTVSIDDTDLDLVATYSDNCPDDMNAGQADNDNDTVYVANAGFPAIGDVDQSDPLTGGDACDTDDDNDGMPDVFEDMFAFLDPFDAADAALDEDGDGLTNLEEYNIDDTGSTIDSDSVGPIVDAPADITTDATGLLTVVDLGTATGTDGNEGEVTLFKVALNEAVADCNALSDLDTDIEFLRPGNHTVTWVSCDSSGNLGSDDQIVNVRPLVSMSSGQSIGEGQMVTIDVVLNGDAIAYPATVNYTLTGTAVAIDDHDGVAGTVSIAAQGEVGTISFNTISDGVVEDDETVIVTLDTPSNVALSNATVHTVIITESNVAPKVTLEVSQAGVVLGHAVFAPDGTIPVGAVPDGNVTIEAIVTGGNTPDFDWSASDSILLAAPGSTVSSNTVTFNPNDLVVGDFYQMSVTVSDGSDSITVNRLLQIKLTGLVDKDGNFKALQDTNDEDGDGDDDLAEGHGDDDADGIPNYLDNLSTPANAIENHTANLETSVLIETDPGLHIALGETAIASGATGVLIGLQDVIDHGGSGGGAVSNAATEHTFLSGLMNFEISGLTENIVSVNVVIPLQSAIQTDAVYRKYNSTGWFDFVIDDLNEVRSAPGVGGVCPQPGSVLYTAGLTAGHLCIQLTIQDGGLNDADGVRNFIVKDPGGLALAPEPEVEVEAEKSGSSSGRLGSTSLWFMLVFLMFSVYLWHGRRRSCVNRYK